MAATVMDAPRVARRWFGSRFKKLAKGVTGLVFIAVSGAYLYKLYLEAWPLMLPLMASNPIFFWVSVVLVIFGAILTVAAVAYLIWT